jgi:hypothetical protein
MPLDPESEVPIPMNVIGNNFASYPVQVRIDAASTEGAESKKNKAEATSLYPAKKQRKSLVGLDENEPAVVSPTALRPLLKKEPVLTPKSILKVQYRNSRSPITYKGGMGSVQKLDRITFSPYNSVKIIAHRTTLEVDDEAYIEDDEEEYGYDDDDDDDEEDEEDEEQDCLYGLSTGYYA